MFDHDARPAFAGAAGIANAAQAQRYGTIVVVGREVHPVIIARLPARRRAKEVGFDSVCGMESAGKLNRKRSFSGKAVQAPERKGLAGAAACRPRRTSGKNGAQTPGWRQ